MNNEQRGESHDEKRITWRIRYQGGPAWGVGDELCNWEQPLHSWKEVNPSALHWGTAR